MKDQYTVGDCFSKDKGRTIFCVVGPGISGDVLLSGSVNQFDNSLQASQIAIWLNKAYEQGRLGVQNEIKEALWLI